MFNVIKKWTKPALFGANPLKQFFLDRSELVHEKYCPPLLCLNPGMQFYIRTKYEIPPLVKIHKDTLTLPDKGVIAFDNISSSDGELSKDSDYVILMFPGIRETTHSVKMQSLAYSLITNGYSNVFVLNYRGSCSIPLMSKQMSHACEGYNDATAGVERLEAMFPDKKIVLVGACMGGQCIVDYLASPHAQTSSVVAGVIHSCVWELSKKALNVSSGIHYNLFNKVFIEDIVRRLFKSATEDEKRLKEEWFNECGIDIEESKKLKTIWELEEYMFSRVNGWSGAEEYYRRVSPKHKVHRITKPLVWINSRDDFMAPFEDFDLTALTNNPNVLLWSTAAGGHVCYVDGLFPVTSYLSKAVPECVELVCQFVEETKQ